MLWFIKNLIQCSCFHDFTSIHHNNTISDFRNNSEIMGNKDNGRSCFFL